MVSARRTSRGNSFSNKEVKEIGDSVPVRRTSMKVPSGLKMEPLSPTLSPSIPVQKNQGEDI